MATIKRFSFFKSYYDSLKNLKKNDKNELTNAILEYVFEDKLPKFSGVKNTIWTLIEPNLTASKKRSNPNSGAPLGNKNASKEKQSKNNQNSIIKQRVDIQGIGVGKGIGVGVGVGYIQPPTTHTQIFNFCTSEFPSYDKKDLDRVAKKIFEHYEKVGWRDVDNWQEKVKMWIEEDISSGKVKEDTSKNKYETIDGITYKNGKRLL